MLKINNGFLEYGFIVYVNRVFDDVTYFFQNNKRF